LNLIRTLFKNQPAQALIKTIEQAGTSALSRLYFRLYNPNMFVLLCYKKNHVAMAMRFFCASKYFHL
ncbi:MAG: hypothetical protein O4965_24625, partial [Trichodesmium sp. St19_bin1]|nr:hypothetical protein [Trichodesmium sp. St19_bin1]